LRAFFRVYRFALNVSQTTVIGVGCRFEAMAAGHRPNATGIQDEPNDLTTHCAERAAKCDSPSFRQWQYVLPARRCGGVFAPGSTDQAGQCFALSEELTVLLCMS
jgi:hypothetical protein